MNPATTIGRQIRLLERKLRRYVAVDGAVTLIIALLVMLGVDFVVDRFFEPSRLIRFFLLLGMVAVAVYVFWLRIGRRVFAEIRDDQLAMVFERFVPSLNESLITSVEFEHEKPREGEVDPLFLERTTEHATETVQKINVGRFFRYGRLAGRVFLALLLTGGAAGLCSAFEETARIWFSRNILLSERDWPRRSRIVVDGFSENGYAKIGRGDSFTLSVRAGTDMPLVPETVRLRVGSRKSGFRTLLLDQFRTDTINGTDWRVFSYAFAEMLETLPISVSAADSTIDGLLVEVVPPPTLVDVRIRQRFPEYMQREDRTVSPSGRIAIPDGTSVTITATSSKPLAAVRATVSGAESVALPLDSPQTFSFPMELVRSDRLVEFTLEDVDGLRNRQPLRFDFSVIKDEPPSVTARLDGIGAAITPVAVLPVVGEITDDNGLASALFRFDIEHAKKESTDKQDDAEMEENSKAEINSATETANPEVKRTVPIAGIGEFQTLFPLEATFSMADRPAEPGDKLALHVEATDKFNLGKPETDKPEPGETDSSASTTEEAATVQTGVGPRWQLEVVSAERLKGLLEIREITLRQRFEVLIGEVEKTKQILDEFSPAATKEQIDAVEASLKSSEKPSDEEEKKREEEREAKRKQLLETIPKEQADAGMYAISRTLRDTQKEVYELRTIVESFQSIRKEMVNNRIFTDEIEQRIDKGIVGPMQSLIDAEFPDADRLLELLNSTLEAHDKPTRTQATEQRRVAIDKFDRILERMRTIRDSMVSMESFNEAIELLRTIIKQQQQIRKETQDEKNQQLKKLLE